MKLDWYTKRLFRLWLPAVIGITVLGLVGLYGGGTARFFLFTHHWFYFMAAFLLFNPVVQTFWPGPDIKAKRQFAAQRARHARQQADRLVQLRQEKVALEQQISSAATKRTEGSR